MFKLHLGPVRSYDRKKGRSTIFPAAWKSITQMQLKMALQRNENGVKWSIIENILRLYSLRAVVYWL